MEDEHALSIQGQEGWGAEQLILLFPFVLARVLPATTTHWPAPRPRPPPDPAPSVDNANGTCQGPRGVQSELYAAHAQVPEPRENGGAPEQHGARARCEGRRRGGQSTTRRMRVPQGLVLEGTNRILRTRSKEFG